MTNSNIWLDIPEALTNSGYTFDTPLRVFAGICLAVTSLIMIAMALLPVVRPYRFGMAAVAGFVALSAAVIVFGPQTDQHSSDATATSFGGLLSDQYGLDFDDDQLRTLLSSNGDEINFDAEYAVSDAVQQIDLDNNVSHEYRIVYADGHLKLQSRTTPLG